MQPMKNSLLTQAPNYNAKTFNDINVMFAQLQYQIKEPSDHPIDDFGMGYTAILSVLKKSWRKQTECLLIAFPAELTDYIQQQEPRWIQIWTRTILLT